MSNQLRYVEWRMRLAVVSRKARERKLVVPLFSPLPMYLPVSHEDCFVRICSDRLLTATTDIVALRTYGQRTQAGMGDTCSAAHTQSSDCRAYFQQRSLGTFDAANSSGVPGNAQPQ